MDRVEVFKNLAVDGLKGLDRDRCSQLLGAQYDQFIHFCDTVSETCDRDPMFAAMITSMSCSIDPESGASFTTKLRDGSEKIVHFDPVMSDSTPDSLDDLPSLDQVEQDLANRDEEEARAKEAKKKSGKSKGATFNGPF